jgi:hypothetical protein
MRVTPGSPRRTASAEWFIEPRLATAIAVVLALHAPLGLLLRIHPAIATAHAGVVVAAVLWVALRGAGHHVLLVAAYVVGSEVLWRMTKAHIPWETGKYLLILVFLAGILRTRGPFRAPIAPVLFILLLLPGAYLSYTQLPWTFARDALSFNLAGPVAIGLAIWFCAITRLRARDVPLVLLAPVPPLLATAGLVLSGFAGASITFGTESSFAASGGYGPNQVSSMMGLGGLLAALLLFTAHGSVLIRGTLALSAGWLMVQSALTFSRGGIYGAAGGIAVALFFIVQDPRLRVRVIAVSAMALLVGAEFMLPRLNEITAGRFEERFTDTSGTGRERLFSADLEIWRENPVFGVGAGIAAYMRPAHGAMQAASHTEQSRLLSEHGLLGLVALLILCWTLARTVLAGRSPAARGVAAALATWSMLFMVHAAVRLAAPALMMGLAVAVSAAPALAAARSVPQRSVREPIAVAAHDE